jgi:hypothetical protein
MSDFDTGGLSQSDTTIFRDEMLSKLPHNFLHNDAIVELLDSYLNGSIIVFMDNLSNVNILGNTNGSVTLDGVWYSNGYWQNEDCISESTLDEEEKVELYTMELSDVRDRLEAEEYMQEYIQPDMFPEV